MALFGNQNKKSIEELENYYSGKQQRTGMAWMMAFLSLILTITVLGGLFLGGRWAYRTFVDDQSDDIALTDTEETASTASPSPSADKPGDDATNTTPPANEGVVSENAARTETPSPQPIPSPSPAPRTTPQATAGAQITRTGTLPNTGSYSMALLIAATALTFTTSYLAFRRLQLARSRNNR